MSIWELDFYSCPILDENKKKLWEILICESPTDINQTEENLFRYAQFCDNQNVNSITLKNAIEEAIKKTGETPKKIRFFRRQMNNMITKACEELGITALPSRRTHALESWLKDRTMNYYPTVEGYVENLVSASVQYPELNAIPLPDAIRGNKGDRWAFVTLLASDFQEMKDWDIAFGESISFSLAQISETMKIPGLLIYSPRSKALSAWMSGLELGYLFFEEKPLPRIRLETGVSDSWILSDLTDKTMIEEAKNFEESKKSCNYVHFLAIQDSPNSESFAGFWLLKS